MAARFHFLCVALTFAGVGCSRYSELYRSMSGLITPCFPQPLDSGPLDLDVRVTKLDIASVDRAHNRVTLVLHKRETWSDEELTFDQSSYNVSGLYVSDTDIWTPDTTVQNSAGPQHVINKEVVLFAAGDLLSVSTVQLTIKCDVSEVNTYSGATCKLQIGSFGLGDGLIRLREPRDDWSFLLDSAFQGQSDYELLSGHTSRAVWEYPRGGPKRFFHDVLTFTFSFRSKYGL
ncbi:acetylcholine-binding protein [Aplysia californica]|uniref:Acetylcholine-binding protein n=1 Tax=Aplysia californica TaxID=6500 RepID=A0ABM0K4U9_APLCA|nr:acetylcholine-binding protein [Aplysia californica]